VRAKVNYSQIKALVESPPFHTQTQLTKLDPLRQYHYKYKYLCPLFTCLLVLPSRTSTVLPLTYPDKPSTAMTTTSARTLASSLDKLTISHGPQIPLKQKRPQLADTWEDEASSDTETESSLTSANPAKSSHNLPSPPPPTPSSPSMHTKSSAFDSQYQTLPPFGMNGSFDDKDSARSPPPRRSAGGADRRPEKTTATASRMIASAIGQAPRKRTEEEKKYDQAMKVQEKKKRDAIKEAEERKKRDLEQARKAIWED
jgi:hypothetical protein